MGRSSGCSRRTLAIILALVSAVSSATVSYFIKANDIDATDFLLMRALGQILAMPIMICATGACRDMWPMRRATKRGSSPGWTRFFVVLQGNAKTDTVHHSLCLTLVSESTF